MDSDRYSGFVTRTLANRIPVILATAEAGFDTAAVARLRAIGRAVAANAPMVADLRDWPFAGWEELPGRVNGRRVGDAPFFDFEYWLYLRILQAVDFPERRIDPFGPTKHRDLDRHIASAETALAATTTLDEALALSLAANAHDLSQIAAPAGTVEVGREALAVDAAAIDRLNIIADNFGAEFVGDLVLALVAAARGIEVVVHVKQVPMFVSDTTMDDVTILLDRVGTAGEFGPRLTRAVKDGAIRFAAHPFWSSPRFLNRLPVEELGSGNGVLNVLKGDLNFRRAVGDVTVPPETAFETLPVLPAAPMLSLRSVKSYCVAGMADWPAGMSRTGFPMDGSLVVAQRVPARDGAPAIAAAESSSGAAALLPRVRRWLRRSESPKP